MNIGLDSSEVMFFMSVTKNAQDKKIWGCRIAKILLDKNSAQSTLEIDKSLNVDETIVIKRLHTNSCYFL